ncbi:MAG: Smr/MutS family protein, partial [Rhizobiaceae bacterium]|nr:Smr/MutS family protein [Rhizobiaceae bacterium]
MSRASKALSDEDRILWHQVARTAKPLKGTPQLPPQPARPETPRDETPAVAPASVVPSAATSATPKRQHVASHFDSQTHEKLARGRLPIEGRVDLHGMTQDEAYFLLLAFLRRAFEDGVRYVLVITGKGARSDGILRRAVPGWLATPPFRMLVSSHD